MRNLELRFTSHPSIYYHQETLNHSLEGRNLRMLTISSHKAKTTVREPDIPSVILKQPQLRAFKYIIYIYIILYVYVFRFKKPTIFISSRVHPGEIQGSYVMKGLIEYLLSE